MRRRAYRPDPRGAMFTCDKAVLFCHITGQISKFKLFLGHMNAFPVSCNTCLRQFCPEMVVDCRTRLRSRTWRSKSQPTWSRPPQVLPVCISQGKGARLCSDVIYNSSEAI